MVDHECKQENTLREMHGDLKTLITEFRNMNGRLLEAVKRQNDHECTSYTYRRKIDVMWSGIHLIKWIILLVFGSGLVFNIVRYMFNNGG